MAAATEASAAATEASATATEVSATAADMAAASSPSLCRSARRHSDQAGQQRTDENKRLHDDLRLLESKTGQPSKKSLQTANFSVWLTQVGGKSIDNAGPPSKMASPMSLVFPSFQFSRLYWWFAMVLRAPSF
jgi:hypothetical protein